MAQSTRLFVGGLYAGVTEDKLRQKFSKFGEIEGIEIKSKAHQVEADQSTVFAFINIKIKPISLAKCFSVFSNCRWKGYPIKLEVAKESFLQRLKKEREGNLKQQKSSNPNFEPIIPREKIKVKNDTLKTPTEDNSAKHDRDEETDQKSSVSENSRYNEFVHKRNKRLHEEEVPFGRDLKFTDKNNSNFEKKFGKRNEDGEAPLSKIRKINTSEKVDDLTKVENGRFGIKKTYSVVERLEKFSGNVWKDDDDDDDLYMSKTMSQKFDKSSSSNVKRLKSIADKVEDAKAKEKFSGDVWKDDDDDLYVSKTMSQKFDKSSSSNVKRLKSIADKVEDAKAKEKLISSALKQGIDVPQSGHKIVFDSDDDGEMGTFPIKTAASKSSGGKLSLFNESEDEVEDDLTEQFKYKPQFDGEAGQKLFELHTRLNNDERFHIDERFKDDKDMEKDNDDDLQQEKSRNLEIFGDIIGGPVKREIKRNEKKSVLVRRYDPTKESCADLVIQRKKIQMPEKQVEKKKEKSKPVEEEKVEVSDKRFHEVSSDLTKLFSKDKSGDNFSLLKTFGRADQSFVEQGNKPPKKERDSSILTGPARGRNPFHYDSSSSDDDEPIEEKKQEPINVSQVKPDVEKISFFQINPKFKEKELSFFNKSGNDLHDNWIKKKEEIVNSLKIRRKRDLRKEKKHIKLFKKKQSSSRKNGGKNFRRKNR
ncbi:nucleolar protein 8 [Chamberlinius hualienensis]